MKKRTKLLALLLSLAMLLSLAACGADKGAKTAEEERAEEIADAVIKADPVVVELLGEDADAILQKDLPAALDFYRAVEQRRSEELLGALRGSGLTQSSLRFAEAELALRLDQSVLEPELLDLLTEMLQMDLSWIQELSLNILSGTEGQLSQSKAVLRLNGTDILHADLIADQASFTQYVAVPELNESYFSANLLEQMNLAGITVDPGEYSEMLKEISSSPEALLGLFQRYERLVIDNLGEIRLQEETLSAGGVSCPGTVAELRLESEDLLRIAGLCMDSAAQDEDLEKLAFPLLKLSGKYTGSREDFGTWYQEKLTKYRGLLQETKPEDLDLVLEMKVYIDAKGEILGRRVEILRHGERMLLLSLLSARDGDKLGAEGEFGFYNREPDGREEQKVLRFSGGGSYSPEGQLSGEFAWSYSGLEDNGSEKKETELSLGSLKLDGKIGRGGFLGEALFTPSAELLDLLLAELGAVPEPVEKLLRSLSLALVNRSADGRLDFAAVLRSKGSDLLTLSLSLQPAEAFAVSVPAEAVDMSVWMQSIGIASLNNIINNLREAGVPAALLNSLMR